MNSTYMGYKGETKSTVYKRGVLIFKCIGYTTKHSISQEICFHCFSLFSLFFIVSTTAVFNISTNFVF